MPHFLINDELIELAQNAIKSFRNSSDVIIISVDDGGEFGNKEEILKPISDVYIKNEKNLGFAKTCNKGFNWIFENEKDDCYIVCANNDIEVYPGWQEAMIEPFNMFENVAVTGIIQFRVKVIDGIPIEKFKINQMTEGGQLRDWQQDGGLLMSRQSILQEVGIFDEQFIRGGYEDVDLFLRMRDIFGKRIVMSGRSAYWHKQGATRWNTEKVGAINNFGVESKSIEVENLKKFIAKWGFNPHIKAIWHPKELWNP